MKNLTGSENFLLSKPSRNLAARRLRVAVNSLLGVTAAVLVTTGQSCRADQPAFQTGALMADAGIKDTESQTGSPQTTGQRILEFISASDGSSGRWSFEFGVGIISDNKPIDYLDFNLHPLKGPGSGHTYNFTIARRIADFDWKVGNTIHLRPQIEVPFRLIIVDQQEGGVIPDVNLGVTFRWRNWPWNRIVATTFSIGVGLSYSSPVWTADIQRHQNQLPRSEVKFWMPLEFTFALPKYPNYQITAFGDHRSGGAIFDVGGIDAWGLGIRVVF